MEARDDGEEGVGEGAGSGAAGAHRGGGGAQGRRHARVEAAFTPEEGHGGKGRPEEVGTETQNLRGGSLYGQTGFYPQKLEKKDGTLGPKPSPSNNLSLLYGWKDIIQWE